MYLLAWTVIGAVVWSGDAEEFFKGMAYGRAYGYLCVLVARSRRIAMSARSLAVYGGTIITLWLQWLARASDLVLAAFVNGRQISRPSALSVSRRDPSRFSY